MKSILGTVLVAVAASRLPSSTEAFTTVASASSVGVGAAPTSSLQATAATADTAAPTIDYNFVRNEIDALTNENFEATLHGIEPFLTETAGASFYRKSMRRITRIANVTGATVPATFAQDAKATEKRRAKQTAFIEGKEEAGDDGPAEEEAADVEAARRKPVEQY